MLHHLLTDNRVEVQIACELYTTVFEGLCDRPHGGARALHIGRAYAIETTIDDLRIPRISSHPAGRLDGGDGIDVPVEGERTTTACTLANADEVRALSILCDSTDG